MSKKKIETRFLIFDSVAVPVHKIFRKTVAYRTATGDGCGTVYKDNNVFVCGEDDKAILVSGQLETIICPNETYKRKDFIDQSLCEIIIHENCSDMQFWEEKNGSVKIVVTRDEYGMIIAGRLDYGDIKLFDDEEVIKFENLPAIDPYERKARYQ